jgi:hypothetical protein
MRWGLAMRPGILIKLKAWAVSSVPDMFLGLLLKFVYSETVKYLEWLRDLRREGPADAKDFLDYMVAQEELQVEMMRLALKGLYPEMARRADDFFLKYEGLMPVSNYGAFRKFG